MQSTFDKLMSNANEINIINDDNKYILCVGLCVLDIIHVCSEFPVEDSDKRSNHGRWQRGGNASNNCTVLSQFGVKCEYFGVLSKTEMFQFVIDDMIKRNIRMDNCVYYENCQAPLSSVLLSEKTGSRTIIHSNPDLPILTFKDFLKINLIDYKWIHFEGRNPNETIKMMEHIKNWNMFKSENGNIIISLDLEKIRPDNLILTKHANYVFLGKDFAVHLGATNKKEAVYKLRDLTAKGNTLICPWGSDGVAALDANDKLYLESAIHPEHILDTLGAGDTFAAATIFALSKNKPIDESIKFATKIASIKISYFGYDNIGEYFNSIEF